MRPLTEGRERRRDGRRIVWLLVGAGVALVVVANAHLVYVAVGSQPDCVPHAKATGEAGGYRTARPAC